MSYWAEICENVRNHKPLRRGETQKLVNVIQMLLDSRDIETAVCEMRELPERYGYEEGSRDWRYYDGLADSLEALEETDG